MWEPAQDWQCLSLREVPLQVRLGVYESERLEPQRISVDVEMWRRRPEQPAASLEDCLDYDRIHRWLRESWPTRPHVDLLESLAEELVVKCFEDTRVEACRVLIRKLDAYPNAGWPEIALARRRPSSR